MTAERRLTAADMVTPSQGELLEVVAGEVLVFASETSGRRIPLATATAGEIVIGCRPADGAEMLVTGLPGTIVRLGPFDIDQPPATGSMEAWAAKLCDAAAAGHWPQRLLAVTEASAMVSPGQHFGAHHTTGWVSVTEGTATLCSAPEALLGPTDPPIVLARGSWLTAGLRCRIEACAPPDDPTVWMASFDTLGKLVLAAVAGRRQRADLDTVTRLAGQTGHADAAAMEAVGFLTRGVGARPHYLAESNHLHPPELEAAITVAQAYGLTTPDDDIGRAVAEVASGRDPVAAVASAFGARVRPVTLTADWWRREGTAMVIHVTGSTGGKRRAMAALWRRGWIVVDPSDGNEVTVTAEVAKGIDRRAVELLAVLPTRTSKISDLARLALSGSGRELAMVAAVTLMLAVLSFATPVLLGRVASLFLTSASIGSYLGLFGALALVVVAGTAWQVVRALALLRARARATAVASGAVWDRTMRQSARWHADRSLGMRSAGAGAVNNASSALPDQTVASLLDIATVTGSLVAVATIAPLMLGALGLLLMVQLALTVVLLRAASRRAHQRVEAAAASTGRLMEILKAVNRLRVAGAESRAFLRWAQLQGVRLRADQSLRRITMVQGVVIAVWPVLALVVVVGVTAIAGLGLGAFVTAQTAASMATMAVAAVAVSANGALVARQSLRQTQPTLASVPESGADGAQPGVLSGGIEVRDLVFRYSPELPAVLEQVNLTVRAGEHVAIVGPSGCGKTTLLRILLGLEQPESGMIAVDGQDLAGLDQPAVRRQIGSVLQSSALLPCSIRDNVDMGRGVSSDAIWAALDAAAVGDDVRALTMGLDTPVPDGGGTLSGGQRQRILIARALVANPRLLVFDEATSSLDNLSQSAVVDTLERQRVTRIVVAHRLSTIRHADRIIVMGAGRVVDEGTFDQLLERPGPFGELARRQLL